MARYTFFYDRDCRVCARLARTLERLDRRGRLRMVALDDPQADRWLEDLAPEERLASAHLVAPGGSRWSGARGVAEVLALLFPPLRPVVWLAWKIPGLGPLLERGYAWFAGHRHRSNPCCGGGDGG